MKSYSLPRWLRVLLLSAVPVVALGMLGLGFWQLNRLEARRARNDEIRQRLAQPPVAVDDGLFTAGLGALDYRPAAARGTFDFAHEIVWRNQARNGAPGVHVITPLRLAGSETAVLVDRGWIPYTQAEPEARAAFQTPAGEVLVSGWLRQPAARTADFLPSNLTRGPGQPRLDAWFWLDITQIQAQMPYPLLPLLLAQAPGPGSAGANPAQLPLPEPEPELSEGSHLIYAIQWFAFAAIALLGPFIYWWRGRREPVAVEKSGGP